MSDSLADPFTKYFAQTVWPKKSITTVLPYNQMKSLPRTINTPLNTSLEFDKLASRYKQGVTGSSLAKMTNGLSIGSAGLDLVGSIIPDQKNSKLTNDINQGYDVAAEAVAAIPGYGPIISGAMKLGAVANKGLSALTGGATTIQNASNVSDSILSSNLFALTSIGLVNSLTKKTIKGSDKSISGEINKGYTPTQDLNTTDIGGITNFTNKLFGGKDLSKTRQKRVNIINNENIKKSSIIKKADKELLGAQNATQSIQDKNYQKLLGGYGTNILAAKEGMKIKEIVSKAKYLAEGGKMNVIPSGALHRELNHLDGEHTKKGIPVIMDNGGNIEQQAEIEREEIIFNLNITKQLEELLKKYDEGDENAAIEAGKLLTTEILENTQDNTGLINKIE